MQKQEASDFICQKHGEKIVPVEGTPRGENKMCCLQCQIVKPLLFEQMVSQLTDLRSNQIQYLVEYKRWSKKRLGSLKELFITIQGELNKQINHIIKTISEGINQMNQNIQKETEQLQQPIQQLKLTQVNNQIMELQKQKQIKDNLFLNKDEQLRNQVIKEYLEVIKQSNQLIQQGSDWTGQNKQSRMQKRPNQNFINEPYIKGELTQYKKFFQEKGIYNCYAMSMDKDEKTLVNGECYDIQVWDFNSDGTIKLKQTLNGHTNYIQCLCFSQNGYWFLSGSNDQSIRIWIIKDNEKWICQQILNNAHKNIVTGIVLNYDEDQLISCSVDETIKVWMKQKDRINWEIHLTLIEHCDFVLFLSFSCDYNSLASIGTDGLRIWLIEKGKVWKHKQVIDNPTLDKHLRILFIDNNQLFATTRYQGRLLRYAMNKTGLFQIQSEFQFNRLEEYDIYSFSIIFNKKLGLVIVRHRDIYLVKKQNNEEFIIHQVLQGDYRAGYLVQDGKYIIIHDYKNDCLVVLK